MKRVLITGSTGEIGKSLVETYLKTGWEVIAPDRKSVDLSSEMSVKTWCENDENIYDAIVLNAGINLPFEIKEFDFEALDEIQQVNCRANIYLLTNYLKQIRSKNTLRIVGISSLYADKSRAGRSAYSMSKSAFEAFICSVALEYADQNVLANLVRPGFIETKMTRTNNSKNEISRIIEQIPLGRLGSPREVALLCSFLTSENNTYITGEKILIDGGRSLN